MFMPRRFWIRGTVVTGLAIVLLIFSASTWATDDVQPEIQETQKLELVVNKAMAIAIPQELKKSDKIRVTIASPGIADFVFIPKMTKAKRPKFIYIKGQKPGVTNMSLWIGDKLFRVYDVEVALNVTHLKQRLHDILPDEQEIRVFASHDRIVLSGTVSNTENLSEALALADAFSPPKSKVVNLLKAGGVHQVMLEVTIAEMSRSAAKKLGINWAWINNRTGEVFVNIIGGLGQWRDSGGGSLEYDVSSGLSGLLRGKTTIGGSDGTFLSAIDFLKGNGLVKILAEPTLISLSGQTASFLAGGEFPIPEIDDEGNVGVEYKSFGVELAFTPTVLSNNKISMKVMPAVSELDFTIATNIAGARVPGLSTRTVSTIVELGDGQSFAIAGLLKETASEDASKYPLLGDVPILGALFKSQAFQNKETELVILVTPRLVEPIDKAEQPLPTDYYIEPDDAEFYLWGIFGKSQGDIPSEKAGLDGEFGHIFTK
jgi:pilus assembly protein CpaC